MFIQTENTVETAGPRASLPSPPPSDEALATRAPNPTTDSLENTSTTNSPPPPSPTPEPARSPEPTNLDLLLHDLTRVLTRFVVLPKHAPETLALWILHTYAFHLRNVSTYIGVESPEKRCGKTTLLSLLSELVNRPVVAANISSSAFFRVIEETQPTLVIDEADTFLQGNDELRGILNAGYTRKTAYVVRVASAPSEAANSTRLARFSSWCPKIMAAIGRLPDTLADRCIVIRIQRKLPREKCERLQSLDASDLRARCAAVAVHHAQAIANARPPIPPALNDRAADIWEPLLALADLAGGSWPALARDAATQLSATAEETNPIGALLLDIFAFFISTKQQRAFSRTLVNYLNALPLRPWAESRGGKGITELWLAQQLRPYHLRPKTLWVAETAAKGYELDEFKDTFRRYIPKSEIDALAADLLPAPGHHEPNGF